MSSRRLAFAAALVAAAAILSATLVPDRSITAGELARASRRFWLLADFARNVILFAPLGLGLAWSGISPLRAILAGALLSALIELSQLAIPGRDPTASDFAANVAGVVLALALFRTAPVWLAPTPARARVLEAVAGAVAALGLVGTAVLLAPAPTATIYYGHLTPLLLPHLAPYGGRVLGAAIDGIEIREGWIADSAGVRDRLRGDHALRVDARAGTPPDRLAALVLITDVSQNEIILLGPDHDDLVYRFRARSEQIGLEPARVRLPDALAGVTPGDRLALGVSRSRGDLCIAVNDTTECGHGLTMGDGWQLVVPDWRIIGRARGLFETAWLAALFAPLGFYARRNAATAAAWAASVAALVLVPAAFPLGPTPLGQIASASFGAGLGIAARRHLTASPAGSAHPLP